MILPNFKLRQSFLVTCFAKRRPMYRMSPVQWVFPSSVSSELRWSMFRALASFSNFPPILAGSLLLGSWDKPWYLINPCYLQLSLSIIWAPPEMLKELANNVIRVIWVNSARERGQWGDIFITQVPQKFLRGEDKGKDGGIMESSARASKHASKLCPRRRRRLRLWLWYPSEGNHGWTIDGDR